MWYLLPHSPVPCKGLFLSKIWRKISNTHTTHKCTQFSAKWTRGVLYSLGIICVNEGSLTEVNRKLLTWKVDCFFPLKMSTICTHPWAAVPLTRSPGKGVGCLGLQWMTIQSVPLKIRKWSGQCLLFALSSLFFVFVLGTSSLYIR